MKLKWHLASNIRKKLRKPAYFLSDAHLGLLAITHRRTLERRLVRFLDSIQDTAASFPLLGYTFDFCNQNKYFVPKR
ncbi:MAG TPA: hypothetical protein DCS83_10275, partial [Prevotella sp.]|nr:hypothetical protein [Prevotella sp.]